MNILTISLATFKLNTSEPQIKNCIRILFRSFHQMIIGTQLAFDEITRNICKTYLKQLFIF